MKAIGSIEKKRESTNYIRTHFTDYYYLHGNVDRDLAVAAFPTNDSPESEGPPVEAVGKNYFREGLLLSLSEPPVPKGHTTWKAPWAIHRAMSKRMEELGSINEKDREMEKRQQATVDGPLPVLVGVGRDRP